MTKNSTYFPNKNKTQNQVVAIGERALVQCVKSCCPPSLESRFPGKIIPFWIPILPERPHSDAEILKFEPLHYYFDFRFWHDRLINLFFTDGETAEDWQARVQLACEVIELTLPGLKTRGFLRHFDLNIPITRVPKLTTKAI